MDHVQVRLDAADLVSIVVVLVVLVVGILAFCDLRREIRAVAEEVRTRLPPAPPPSQLPPVVPARPTVRR